VTVESIDAAAPADDTVARPDTSPAQPDLPPSVDAGQPPPTSTQAGGGGEGSQVSKGGANGTRKYGNRCQTTEQCAKGLACHKYCEGGLGPQPYAPDDCSPAKFGICLRGAQKIWPEDPDPVDKTALDRDAFMFVFEAGDALYLVLDELTEPLGDSGSLAVIDHDYPLGKPTEDTIESKPSFSVYERPPVPGEMTAQDQAWVGREVHLLTARGSCAATVGRLSVLARVWWPEGEGDEGPVEARYIEYGPDLYRGARLKTSGDCQRVVGARAMTLPVPTASVPSRAPRALAKRAVKAFQSLAVFQLAQARITSQAQDPKDRRHLQRVWSQREDSGTFQPGFDGAPQSYGPEVVVFEYGGQKHVVLTVDKGDACTGLGEAYTIWWRLNKGRLVLEDIHDKAIRPTLAVDLDGDGEPELIQHSRYYGTVYGHGTKSKAQFSSCAQYGC
jgi:hypothetical protein